MDTTQLLRSVRLGDREAVDQLYERVHRELHRLAHAQLRRRGGSTLDTTALVGEAYLKLADGTRLDVEDRAHFLALSACAMRQILVDHFRRGAAARRGGGMTPVTLIEDQLPEEQRGDVLLALDEAVQRLARQDERLARVVEYKFFGGMSYEEIGGVLGIAARTVRKDWFKARALLTVMLQDGPPPEPGDADDA